MTDVETARALIRELHEATKDAKAAAREVGEAVDLWSSLGAEMKSNANELIDNIYKQVVAEMDNLRETTDKVSDKIIQRHSELLGMQTPEAVVRHIGDLLQAAIEPSMRVGVMTYLETHLPGIVNSELMNLAERGTARVKERVRRAAMITDTLWAEEGDNGASGAVPGRQGHQS